MRPQVQRRARAAGVAPHRPGCHARLEHTETYATAGTAQLAVGARFRPPSDRACRLALPSRPRDQVAPWSCVRGGSLRAGSQSKNSAARRSGPAMQIPVTPVGFGNQDDAKSSSARLPFAPAGGNSLDRRSHRRRERSRSCDGAMMVRGDAHSRGARNGTGSNGASPGRPSANFITGMPTAGSAIRQLLSVP